MVVTRKNTTIDLSNFKTKSISNYKLAQNNVIFFLNKMEYLVRLSGRSYETLFFIISNSVCYNTNFFGISKAAKEKIFKEYGITQQALNTYLTNLLEANILKKVHTNGFLYNPHIFVYGDYGNILEMQRNFICEFDKETKKIHIKKIYYADKVYTQDKVYSLSEYKELEKVSENENIVENS